MPDDLPGLLYALRHGGDADDLRGGGAADPDQVEDAV